MNFHSLCDLDTHMNLFHIKRFIDSSCQAASCWYMHVHVCVYVSMCICACMYVHVCMYISICAYAYVCVCMCVCVYVYVCGYMHVCMCMCSSCFTASILHARPSSQTASCFYVGLSWQRHGSTLSTHLPIHLSTQLVGKSFVGNICIKAYDVRAQAILCCAVLCCAVLCCAMLSYDPQGCYIVALQQLVPYYTIPCYNATHHASKSVLQIIIDFTRPSYILLCSAQLYPTALQLTVLHCTSWYSTATHCYGVCENVLCYTMVHYTTLHYTTLHYTTPHHTTPIRAHTTLHWTNAEANANVIASVSASHAMVHARVDALADVQGQSNMFSKLLIMVIVIPNTQHLNRSLDI